MSAAAFLVCFAFFPMLLLNTALDRILRIQYDTSMQKARHKLERALDVIENNVNNDRFAHLLLNRFFSNANASDDPAEKLAADINRLKKRYPDTFFFIVWNDKGQTISSLTDEPSYAYILKETFRLLSDAAKNTSRFYTGLPRQIPNLEKRLKTLRHYLGRLLIANEIDKPLQPGELAGTILAEPSGNKNRLWYGIGKKISFLCFINQDFFKSKAGIIHALGLISQTQSQINGGICEYPFDKSSVFQINREILANEILIAAGKFENMHPDSLISQGRKLFAFRYINQKQRAFVVFDLKGLLSVGERKKHLVADVSKWLIVALFIGLVYYRKTGVRFIPINFKITCLFLYASGVPLLIITIVGADYLQQKRQELIYTRQTEGLEELRIIDESFGRYLQNQGDQINHYLKASGKQHANVLSDKKACESLKRDIIKKYRPNTIMLMGADGKNRFSEADNEIFSDSTIISQITRENVVFFNSPITSALNLSMIARPLANETLSKIERINQLSLGKTNCYAYYCFMGNPSEHTINSFLYLFWQQEKLQKAYIEETLKNKNDIIACFTDSDTFADNLPLYGSEIAELLHKTQRALVIRDSALSHNGKTYAAAAMCGKNLNKTTLATLVPIEQVDNEIWEMYKQFAFVGAVFLFLSIGAGFIMRRRLLKPLFEFKQAIEYIGQRNFACKIESDGQNEFGQLGKALNSTLDNLRELEVARIVQENLLPGKIFEHDSITAFAAINQMSQIGGDYYDFFAVNEQQAGFFIGDVSGHGISSALVMAMAKATLIYENFAEPQQEQLMRSMNKTIFNIRQAGSKDYMTGQAIYINSLTGDFSVINAGHCFPIIIRASNGTTEYLQAQGLPLGFKKNINFTATRAQLADGDFLVLYTDGWIEAESASGVAYGFERFARTLASCIDKNCELTAQKMFSAISKWEMQRHDDLTLIIINYRQKNAQQ